jgi:uncharacterized protein (TIGR02246 family)
MSPVETVLRIEHTAFAAIARKDTRALAELLADDFVYRSPGSPDTGKTEFLQNIAALPVEIVSLHGEEVRAAVLDDVVVVTGLQRAVTRAASGGVDTPSATAFTDVFARREGAWRLVLAYGVELPSGGAQ